MSDKPETDAALGMEYNGAEGHETDTVASIIAEMRDTWTDTPTSALLDLADRIEAAAARERKLIPEWTAERCLAEAADCRRAGDIAAFMGDARRRVVGRAPAREGRGNEMNAEPSPRPWRAEQNVVGWTSFIVDANGDGVAACWRTARGDDEKERQYNEANAALIVAAVNERDRLRDALKRIAGYEDGIVGCIESGHASGIDWDGITFAMIQEARAALGEDKP